MLNYNKTRTSNTSNQTSNHLQTFNKVLLPSPNLGSNLIFVSPSQPDNEVVPETQDTQKHKKDVTWTNPRTKPKVIRKNAKTFEKVTVTWHKVMGFDAEYHTYHQLNSKWKDMCTKLTKFSGIYSNCANIRKNGMSDENVLKWADKEYQLKSNGQTFNHYHVWVAIKDSPKFRVLCQEGYEVQCS
ncbi:hypothetical protein R6Q57_017455 [Mikania cordata]